MAQSFKAKLKTLSFKTKMKTETRTTMQLQLMG